MVKTNETDMCISWLIKFLKRRLESRSVKSARPVDIRSKELDGAAVPLPFEIYATIQTVKYKYLKKHILKTIDRLTDLRIRQNLGEFSIATATNSFGYIQ